MGIFILSERLAIQHAGPKLSGYTTSRTTTTTVAQSVTPGFLRDLHSILSGSVESWMWIFWHPRLRTRDAYALSLYLSPLSE